MVMNSSWTQILKNVMQLFLGIKMLLIDYKKMTVWKKSYRNIKNKQKQINLSHNKNLADLKVLKKKKLMEFKERQRSRFSSIDLILNTVNKKSVIQEIIQINYCKIQRI